MSELLLANLIIDNPVHGKGLKSPLEKDEATGDFKRVSGEDNIKQCIIDLLTTRVGERQMNEDFGTEFPPMLFENIEGLVDVLPPLAVEAILRWEPRVTQVNATARRIGQRIIQLDVSYVVRSTGRRDNLVYPFYTEAPTGGVAQ